MLGADGIIAGAADPVLFSLTTLAKVSSEPLWHYHMCHTDMCCFGT